MRTRDFVQGWRPKPEGGFSLNSGVFIEFCNRACIDAAWKYVLIIDETNRGNLSKILNELMMLIEADKRGAKNAIPLTYSDSDGEGFFVPENVYLLGLIEYAPTVPWPWSTMHWTAALCFLFFDASS